MNPIRALALAGLFALVPVVGSAQTKVGYVDVDRVTRKAKAVNQTMDSVQSDIEVLQKQIDEKRQQIKDLEADVQRSEGVIAASEIEKKRKEITRLRNELDDLGYRAERKARELDATVFEPLMKRILFAIQDVAKEQKYDVILRGEAVLYGTSGADITDDVIRKLNEEPTTGSDTIRSQGEATKKSVPSSAPAREEDTRAQARPTAAAASPQPKETPRSSTGSGKKGSSESGRRGVRPVDRQPE
jgi:outer membrane protein